MTCPSVDRRLTVDVGEELLTRDLGSRTQLHDSCQELAVSGVGSADYRTVQDILM